ncbi:hypothetical protein D3C76_1200630 [compost metagenome]
MASAKTRVQKLKAKDYGFKPFQKMPGTQQKKFHKFHESLFESPAWNGLTIHSKMLYIEMSRKFNGTNESEILFLQKEGVQIMGKNTFHKCIKQLVDHGFIEYVQWNKYNSLANVYGFSTRWHTFIPEQTGKSDSS